MSSINTIWAKLTSFPFYTIKVLSYHDISYKLNDKLGQRN